MKFKRVDADTVRCLISEQELMENGLSVEDFLQNDGKTEDFLRRVITLAEENVGYKVRGGNITIQVSVLPDHVLALTFSEKMDAGILGMLENLKSAVERLSKDTAQEQANETEQSRETAGQQAQNAFLVGGGDSFQICFLSLDRAGEYCAAAVPDIPVESSLYKLEEENVYFLILKKGDMDKRQLCRMLGASLEFAAGIYAHTGAEAYIQEHGSCIVEKDAIGVLGELYG